VTEQEAVAAAPSAKADFFWSDLSNGNIGFPTGTTVPAGMPGSVMKLITAAMLSEEHVVKPEDKIECRGLVEIGKQSYSCLYPHGEVDLVQALGLSCNVYFAQRCQHLAASMIIDYAKRFGLDTPVSGYKPGAFPTKPASSAVAYGLGLAKDLQPNALQVMRLSALVGEKGKIPVLRNPSEPCDEKPVALELHGTTWEILQQGMKLAGREGTARKLDPQNLLHVAVKTGTTPHGKIFQSWITGYFPYQDPKYAFVLRASSGTSQEQAVPLARNFLMGTKWP
jgi:penicillin-binding protein 2